MKNEERHQNAVDKLTDLAGDVYDQIDSGKIPKMMIPLRTKSNIRFDPKTDVWKYGKAMGARSAKKLTGAQMLLRTMYMLEFIEDMIKEEKSSRGLQAQTRGGRSEGHGQHHDPRD
jgi:DNA topoisomerase-6 subunit A